MENACAMGCFLMDGSPQTTSIRCHHTMIGMDIEKGLGTQLGNSRVLECFVLNKLPKFEISNKDLT